MIREECKKLTNPGMILLVLFFISFHWFTVCYEELSSTPYFGEYSYKELWKQTEEKLKQEDISTVYRRLKAEYEENFFSGLSGAVKTAYVQKRVLDELEGILNYQDYLDRVLYPADMPKIFQQQEKETYFTRQNKEKTLEAYKKMISADIVPAPSLGIELISSAKATDLTALFLLLLLQIRLWSKEKEEGMLKLFHTCCRGRRHLTAAKVKTAFLSCLFITLVLYGGNLLLAQKMYGLGDLHRNLASVYLFRQTAWNINIWQFLMFFFLFKVCALFLFGLFFGVAAQRCSSTIGTVLASFAVTGLCCFLYENGSGALQYVLPYGLLRTENIFEIYRNLNIFGFPVEYTLVSCCLLSAGIGLNIFLMLKRNTADGSGKLVKSELLQRIYLFFQQLQGRRSCTVSLLIHETKKIFIKEKVLFLLLLLCVLQVSFCKREPVRYYDFTQLYYSRYMDYLSGELTPNKEAWLREEEKTFEELLETGEGSGITDLRMQQKLQAYEAFLMVKEYYQYIRDSGLQFMVHEEALQDMTAFGTNRTDALLAFEALLFCVLCSSLIFGRDYHLGTDRFCGITYYGKKKAPFIRIVIGAVINLIILLLVYLPFMHGILQSYQIDTKVLLYPAGCLRNLGKYGSNITLGGYFLLLMLLRYLFLNMSALFVFMLSGRLRSLSHTVSVGAGILIFPLLPVAMNDAIEPLCFLFSPILGNYLLKQNMIVILTGFVLVTGITGLLVYDRIYAKHKYIRKKRI